MKNITESINQILSEWDPLNLGEDIAIDEYKGYIPQILKNIKNKDNLIICLENILIYNLEAGYDKKNNTHKNMLNNIIEKIMQLDLAT